MCKSARQVRHVNQERAFHVNILWQNLLSNDPQDTKGFLSNILATVSGQICQQQESKQQAASVRG